MICKVSDTTDLFVLGGSEHLEIRSTSTSLKEAFHDAKHAESQLLTKVRFQTSRKYGRVCVNVDALGKGITIRATINQMVSFQFVIGFLSQPEKIYCFSSKSGLLPKSWKRLKKTSMLIFKKSRTTQQSGTFTS